MPISTPRLITQAIVAGLKPALQLTDEQCYPIIQVAYVDGQPPTVLQVVEGGAHNDGAGQGFQEGGAFNKTQLFPVTIWRRVKLDRHARSDKALLQDTVGLSDLAGALMEAMGNTNLGGLVQGRLMYVDETPADWYDAEAGVCRKDVIFAATFGVRIPNKQTM